MVVLLTCLFYLATGVLAISILFSFIYHFRIRSYLRKNYRCIYDELGFIDGEDDEPESAVDFFKFIKDKKYLKYNDRHLNRISYTYWLLANSFLFSFIFFLLARIFLEVAGAPPIF